ncbi:MAG: hypothetical protein AAF481_12110 [Acidobacteriota bacterium]
MRSPLEFKQVAADIPLYEIQVPDSLGWAGYVLPNSSDLPSEIEVGASLERFPGSYFFAVYRPSIVEHAPDEFAELANDYVRRVTRFNRLVAWLENIEPEDGEGYFGDIDNFGFQFGEDINGYKVRSNLNAALGTNLNFFVTLDLDFAVDVAEGALVVTTQTGPNPLIGYQKGGDDLGISVGDARRQSARIPLSGANAASFVLSAEIKPSITFSPEQGLEAGFEYVVNNQSVSLEEPVHYPAFNVASLPAVVNSLATVDPSDPVNSRISTADLELGFLRTGFALTGAPALSSWFSSVEGKAVSLVPLGTKEGAAEPARSAGSLSVASSSPTATAPGKGVAYFGLAGRFAMSVAGEKAGVGQALLCGIFGSERLTFVTYDPEGEEGEQVTLYFLPSQPAYAPVFPFDTVSINEPASGAVVPRLTGEYAASWATVQGAGSAVAYSAEPAGSPLYGMPETGQGETAVLKSTPPSLPLPQGNDHSFPMVPYAGATDPGVEGTTLTQFESEILAATRKTTISEAAVETWQARADALRFRAQISSVDATTPQGLLAEVDPASGAYLDVTLAQSTDRAGEMVPFAFHQPTRTVQDALQTNQLFLVAVNNQPFDDSATGAVFENVVNIVDWTMTARVGQGATATSYRNVMILKFCDGSLMDRVTNPNRWTSPKDFSLVADAGEIEALAYTGLSQWLQAYLAEGVARADGRSAIFYENFAEIAMDPEWNGVIVLKSDLGAEDLPPEIQGLAAGIDFSNFTAHHFGFTVSRVQVDPSSGAIALDGVSSLFGLVDYEDPAYGANLAAGVDPNTPIPVATSNDFEFTVLRLQSLFENARLVKFQSNVQLTVDRLFGSTVPKAFNNSMPQPATGVVLDGSYIDQNGEGSYVFQQTQTTVFSLAGNVLPAMAFRRVQFNTLGPRDGGASVASRFLIWGAFDFVELTESDGGMFDVLSFGSPPDTPPEQLGSGLAVSNLLLEMVFPLATPNAKRFALDTDNMAYDVNSSSARDESLFRGFGLELKSFINASGDKTPADYGFLPVTSKLNLKQLEGEWFGVVYEVTLGGPGALASAAGFTSNLLLAWAPSTAAGDSQRAVFLGLSLPGAAPGAKLFSIEGVFKVAIGSISLLRQPVPQTAGSPPTDDSFYCLRLDDIGIKIFGIVKLPPDANIQFFLFGDPSNTGSLGWYAAYVATDNPGCNQQLAFARVDSPEAERAALKKLPQEAGR